MTLACPICESHRAADYAVVGYGWQPGGVERFAVLRCRQHGVEFADALPLPEPDERRKESLDHLYGASAIEPQARYVDFMDRVERVAGRPAGGLLHDVGCGNGHLLLEARRRGWRVEGNDIVASVRDEIARHGVTCLIGNLSELDLATDSCDVVTSFCVLPHHLTDPSPEMAVVLRMLRPGGWFVLQLPVNGPMRRATKLIYRLCWPWRPTRLARFVLGNLYGPGGHQFAFSEESLGAYLRKCGFCEVTFSPYRLPSRYTLTRFAGKPWWLRGAARGAVTLLGLAGHALRLPNHAIGFARKPVT